MGYPKQPTETQRKEALDDLVHAIRRDLAASAYVRDRAEQYPVSSGIYEALTLVAVALEVGEHQEAFRAGELDDLIERAMQRRSDRIRREGEAHLAEVQAAPSVSPTEEK